MRARIVIILVALTAVTAVQAQAKQMRQYAAKFVCGRTGHAEASNLNFAPGQYFSTINVHNPTLGATIQFQKKFALALAGENAGKIYGWFPAALKADQAMQIDCYNIYKHLGLGPGNFIEGFVVIQLVPDQELDVEGVYTAAGNAGVSTMHMERVAGRLTQ